MSKAKLTLIGLSSYAKAHNSDIFELLTLPDGIDKETLTDNIILRSAEFEVIYSDPEYMRLAIGVWAKKSYRTFEKWVKALSIDYNPLENYDRIEDWTDTGESSGNSIGQNNNTIEDKKSAFDSNIYENSALNTNNSHTDSNYNNNNSNVHVGRLHGNIGVTTSQQMLEAELNISKWNLYDQITDLFINEFCLLVY